MNDDTEAFLNAVMSFVEKHPEIAVDVGLYASAGLQKALDKANERAADMEVALVAVTARRYKGAEDLVKEKLRKWEGKTSCRWDWLLHPGKK